MRALRGVAATAVAVGMAVGLAGCGGGAADPKPSASASGRPDIIVETESMSMTRAGNSVVDIRNPSHTPIRAAVRVRLTVPGPDAGKVAMAHAATWRSTAWTPVTMVAGPAMPATPDDPRVPDPVTLTGTFSLTVPPGESHPGLRIAPSFPTPAGLYQLPFEADLLDARGRLLDRKRFQTDLVPVDAVLVSAPDVLPRDGRWRTMDFTVGNASTVTQHRVLVSVDPECTVDGGLSCPASGGATKGLRLQWRSPDGWREVPASGIDLPRATMRVGETRTLRLRVAATTRLDKASRYQVDVGVSLPRSDDDNTAWGAGDRALMTVR